MTSFLKKVTAWAGKNIIGVAVASIVVTTVALSGFPAHGFDGSANPAAIRYSSDVSTTTSLCRPATYQLDLDDLQVNRVSVQVVYSTYTALRATVFDGAPSTISLTISSNSALAAATSFMQVTISSLPAISAATAYVNIYVASNTALVGASVSLIKSTSPDGIHPTTFTFLEGRDWSRNQFNTSSGVVNLANNSSMTAISIASALDFSTYGVTASTPSVFIQSYISTGTQAQTNASIVIVRAIQPGFYGNYWSMQTSTPAALMVAYSTATAGSVEPPGASTRTTPVNLRSGRDAAVITLITDATRYFTAGKDFAVGTTSTQTALNVAAVLNYSSYSIVASTNDGAVYASRTSTGAHQVLVQAVTAGEAGNLYQLKSSTQFALVVALSTTVSGAKAFSGPQYLHGGRDAAYLIVNGSRFTNGVDWVSGSVASATAFSISLALANDHLTSSATVMVSTAQMFNSPTLAILYSTSVLSGPNRVGWLSSTQAALTLSNMTTGQFGSSTGTMTGGSSSQFSTNSYTFLSTNTFIFSQGVWVSTRNFSAALNSLPGRLVPGSTYFVTVASGSGSSDGQIRQSFTLAHTSTGAAAGVPWTGGLSTQSAQGGRSFELVPVTWEGAATFSMAVSNNGTQWVNTPPVVSGASITVTMATLPNSTTFYDLGTVNYRHVRFNIEASSATPSIWKVNVNGRY